MPRLVATCIIILLQHEGYYFIRTSKKLVSNFTVALLFFQYIKRVIAPSTSHNLDWENAIISGFVKRFHFLILKSSITLFVALFRFISIKILTLIRSTETLNHLMLSVIVY